ncbi:hypothetical protein PspS35_14435 [Pseudomonas sp. S35]|uniref:hypothetical protein n=1 Tax=Pseudomonas sp. S35 TaxID=1573719 RepID=UPI00132F3B4C|nr:hypothetical protein [Pseudomonas sp. S35]QHF44915.1 hypothetical protein PspS35_14435 [Pseudomonas sp. S35]
MSTESAKTSPGQPNQLPRLSIPGMTDNVDGYDGGIPAWLMVSGLTVRVDNNWLANLGDIISIVLMPSMTLLALKRVQPREEENESYFFSIPRKKLPDGELRLGYVVNFKGNKDDYEASYPLSVLVKTDLPAGEDIDQLEPGHSELKFSLSTLEVYPPDAAKGVSVIIQPYPNMHPMDRIYFQWGGLTIVQQVAGVGQATLILINHAQITKAGDSDGLLVGFYVVDHVGNASTPRSRNLRVLVALDSAQRDGPFIQSDDRPGYIDLERLNGADLTVGMYTPAPIGRTGDWYVITFKAYPPLGGEVVHRRIETITRAGTATYHDVPYSKVRAAAGGWAETSYELIRADDLVNQISKKTFAEVVGPVIRLEAPYFEKYPEDIAIIEKSMVVNIPWYDWRKPTDNLTLILRYVKSLNEVILYSVTKTVGTFCDGQPVQWALNGKDIEQFLGYAPDLYFVYESKSASMKARSMDLNESLRRRVQILQGS